MVTENKLKDICNFIICLKGNSTALVMDKLRMNDVSQLDKFIKREEIKSLQGRRQMQQKYVYVLIFQNKILMDESTVVIQRDKGLSVIKILTRRSKNRLETLKTVTQKLKMD